MCLYHIHIREIYPYMKYTRCMRAFQRNSCFANTHTRALSLRCVVVGFQLYTHSVSRFICICDEKVENAIAEALGDEDVAPEAGNDDDDGAALRNESDVDEGDSAPDAKSVSVHDFDINMDED